VNRIRLAIVLRRWIKRGLGAVLLLGTLGGVAFGILWHISPFPQSVLDQWPASPVVTDRNGDILLSVVGRDDQWRFPVPLERISPWLIQATIAIEDERFESHAGVDPIAVLRAAGQNLAAFRTVSGASTLTMQVCRMMDNRPRGLAAKAIESFRALQLERVRDKKQILETYLNIAPYSRNYRGVEAASLAYFGKKAVDLSLSEAALLVALPQSPNRYRPDRRPGATRQRRNYILQRMQELGMITPEQATLAAAAPVMLARPTTTTAASHAAWMALLRRPAGGRTTITRSIQAEVDRLAGDYLRRMPAGSQAAIVVLDIAKNEIVAMLGAANADDPVAAEVNGAQALRSPGSALKPFIYAAAFEAGLISDQSTVYDVPIERTGWSPANFDRQFSGELPAADALRRSLNVPAILVAEATGLTRCLGLVEACGIGLPRDVQTRGGLAVVVGATEVTLLDLVNGYATIGRGGIRCTPRLFADEKSDAVRVLSEEVCAVIDDILSSRRRTPRGMLDRDERTIPWFMWKTGTSSGRRDAWAVGHNHRYAIGVWIGRFSGAGSERFVGAEAAEPLLAAMFDLPELRNAQDPPPARPLPAAPPLAPPVELAGLPHITSPAANGRYLAMNGEAIIPVRATPAAGLNWFLNGLSLDEQKAQRLVLKPGQYELRCTSSAGLSTAVEFTVIDIASVSLVKSN